MLFKKFSLLPHLCASCLLVGLTSTSPATSPNLTAPTVGPQGTSESAMAALVALMLNTSGSFTPSTESRLQFTLVSMLKPCTDKEIKCTKTWTQNIKNRYLVMHRKKNKIEQEKPSLLPVWWIRIQTGSVFRNFVDPDPHGENRINKRQNV